MSNQRKPFISAILFLPHHLSVDTILSKKNPKHLSARQWHDSLTSLNPSCTESFYFDKVTNHLVSSFPHVFRSLFCLFVCLLEKESSGSFLLFHFRKAACDASPQSQLQQPEILITPVCRRRQECSGMEAKQGTAVHSTSTTSFNQLF